MSDPANEVLADLDDHEALTKRGYIFDRIFFGVFFLLIVLLAHSYGMAMGKFLIIASLVSTSIYMCFPIHFVSKLCEFLEWVLIVSGILIKMQISSAQTMIGFVDAFLALVCRLAYQISGISRVKTRMKKIVQEIKDGNSSTGCIEEYQRVRMRLFTLRMIFLSLGSILTFFVVFFCLWPGLGRLKTIDSIC